MSATPQLRLKKPTGWFAAGHKSTMRSACFPMAHSGCLCGSVFTPTAAAVLFTQMLRD